METIILFISQMFGQLFGQMFGQSIGQFFILIVLICCFVAYNVYLMKTNKRVSGNDLHMHDNFAFSTMTSCMKIKTNSMKEYENQIKKRLNELYRNESVMSRTILCVGKNYEIVYLKLSQREIDNLVDLSVRSINTKEQLDNQIEIGNILDADHQIIKTLSESYFESNPKFVIILDHKNMTLYIKTNHVFFDGWTLNRLLSKLMIFDPVDQYNITVPKFTYTPLLSEYCLIRTMYDMITIPKSPMCEKYPMTQEAIPVKDIVHIKFDKKMFTKSKITLIAQYTYQIMSIMFNSYDFDQYNLMILAAMDNPNKINNVSGIILTVRRSDSLQDLERMLRNKQYMVWGLYFFVNFLTKSRKSSNIDIVISSIPFIKSNTYGNSNGSAMMFLGSPIYVFNNLIGEEMTSSIHFQQNSIPSANFIEEAKKVVPIFRHDIME
jgi:hypothetical protein